MLMCIHMLTKRAQILFEKSFWKYLKRLAKEQKVSVGKLVRDAVQEKYFSDSVL